MQSWKVSQLYAQWICVQMHQFIQGSCNHAPSCRFAMSFVCYVASESANGHVLKTCTCIPLLMLRCCVCMLALRANGTTHRCCHFATCYATVCMTLLLQLQAGQSVPAYATCQ